MVRGIFFHGLFAAPAPPPPSSFPGRRSCELNSFLLSLRLCVTVLGIGAALAFPHRPVRVGPGYQVDLVAAGLEKPDGNKYFNVKEEMCISFSSIFLFNDPDMTSVRVHRV